MHDRKLRSNQHLDSSRKQTASSTMSYHGRHSGGALPMGVGIIQLCNGVRISGLSLNVNGLQWGPQEQSVNVIGIFGTID